MLILAAIPLGNPADASLNLREAIVSAKFIAAEDSRKFSRLCLDLGITYSAKIISFFEGNEIERLDEIVKILESGSENSKKSRNLAKSSMVSASFRLTVLT
jgi:16S rRNA (cytidine1402-2'-O)-methyltransferase